MGRVRRCARGARCSARRIRGATAARWGRGGGDRHGEGLLLQFRRLADLPHFADELKVDLTDSWKKNELSDTLQQLSEGREYVRATRDSRSTRVGWAFPGCAALACESDPGDFLRKGGAVRRYLPLRGPYSSVPLGTYVDRLASNYGHLGRALVHALVAAGPEKRTELATHLEHARAKVDAVVARVCPGERDHEHVQSWGRQIAVALAAAAVTFDLCPELCPKLELWVSAILTAFESILRDRGDLDAGGDIVGTMESKIKTFVAQNRARLLPTPHLRKSAHSDDLWEKSCAVAALPSSTQPIREPIGQIVAAHDEGTPDEILVHVDIFQDVLSRFVASEGQSMGTLSREFTRRGFVLPDKATSKQGGHSRRSTIGGTRARVYRLALRAGEDEPLGTGADAAAARPN